MEKSKKTHRLVHEHKRGRKLTWRSLDQTSRKPHTIEQVFDILQVQILSLLGDFEFKLGRSCTSVDAPNDITIVPQHLNVFLDVVLHRHVGLLAFVPVGQVVQHERESNVDT